MDHRWKFPRFAGFWAPFAASHDYFLLGMARVWFYGSLTAASVLLFYFRDCLEMARDESMR